MKTDRKFWTIAIMILIFALLAGSVAAASINDVSDKFKEQGKKFNEWRQKFLTRYVLLSAVALTVVFFLLFKALEMWKGTSYSSSMGPKVFIPILAILSLIICAQIVTPGEYIWQKVGVRTAMLSAFGDANCEYDLRDAEIAGLKEAQKGYYTTTTTVVEGEQVEQRVPEQSWMRSGVRKLPLGSNLIDSAEGVVESYNKKIEVVSKDAENSKKFCYTAASKLPKAERPDDTSPSDENPLLGWGILRGGRLFILIGSIIVFYLLFKVVSPNLDNTARVPLTIMFAITTAQANTAKSQFLNMAYWVLLFLLYKTFAKQTGEGEKTGEGMAWGLSFGTVHTLAITTFRQYGLGLPMFPQTGSFISNFMYGFIFGLILGMVKGGQNSFFRKSMGNLGKNTAKGKWNNKGKLFKGAANVLTLGIPYGAWKLGGWGIGKFRNRIGGKIRVFGEEAKLLAKENSQRNEISKKKGEEFTEEDERTVNGLVWGEGNVRSRTIWDMKQEIIDREDALLKELGDAIKKEKKDDIDRLKRELSALGDKKRNFAYVRKNSPGPGNPTYDGLKPTFDKSINGILDSLAIDTKTEQNREESFIFG